MTNAEFVKLHESGHLRNISVWMCDVKNKYGDVLGHHEMMCFIYDNKYYIRISKLNGLSRLYHEELRSAFIREFDNKDSANRYFNKVKQSGYERLTEA